jgi:hypothetical protein
MTNRCAGFYVFTRRARVRPEPRLYSVNLKATGAPEILKSALRRGPHQSRYERARVDARSLRLPQRIIIDFVQALDFAAVEALIPNLQPSAESSRCTQILDGITDRLSRRRETPVFGAVPFVGFARNSSAGAW